MRMTILYPHLNIQLLRPGDGQQGLNQSHLDLQTSMRPIPMKFLSNGAVTSLELSLWSTDDFPHLGFHIALAE